PDAAEPQHETHAAAMIDTLVAAHRVRCEREHGRSDQRRADEHPQREHAESLRFVAERRERRLHVPAAADQHRHENSCQAHFSQKFVPGTLFAEIRAWHDFSGEPGSHTALLTFPARSSSAGAAGSPVTSRISFSSSVSRSSSAATSASSCRRCCSSRRRASSWLCSISASTSASISSPVASLNGFSPRKLPSPARYGFLLGASCTRPSFSLMPQRVTMLRASSVACAISFSAPVVFVPYTISSAARPPSMPTIRARKYASG